jgi:hypothetical protein
VILLQEKEASRGLFFCEIYQQNRLPNCSQDNLMGCGKKCGSFSRGF